MPNREKVIKGLEGIIWEVDHNSMWLPGDDDIRDALALLKQDAVEPKTGHWIYKKYDDMFMCSSCEKYSIRNDYPYCHWCGAKMEGR